LAKKRDAGSISVDPPTQSYRGNLPKNLQEQEKRALPKKGKRKGGLGGRAKWEASCPRGGKKGIDRVGNYFIASRERDKINFDANARRETEEKQTVPRC